MKSENRKIFLIINLSCLGDVILTDSLCQNLKKEYPQCKIVFLVDKPFFQAAEYLDCVDDVVFFDKRNEHKGIIGLFKFIAGFKYKNKISASFIIYGNFRGILLSFLLNIKRRISSPTKYAKYLLTDILPETPDCIPIEDVINFYFKCYLQKEPLKLPIKYNVSPNENKLAVKLKNEYKDMIAFCPVSEEIEKNMPISTAIKIINRLSEENKTVLFLGKGILAENYSNSLKQQGCNNFIDLTNSTSIYDLANILSICDGTISIDTGTMHLSYAVEKPTVCVFYKKSNVAKWAPKNEYYNVYVEDKDFSFENICNKLKELIMK